MLRFLTFLWLALNLTSPAHAQAARRPPAGVGIGFGSVDGISAYYRYSPNSFFQSLLAFEMDDAFYLSADLCNLFQDVLPDAPAVVPYYCLGGFFSHVEVKGRPDKYFDEDVYGRRPRRDVTIVGARIPFGVQIFIPRMPLQFAVELVPGLAVTPGTDFYIQHLIALRYLF